MARLILRINVLRLVAVLFALISGVSKADQGALAIRATIAAAILAETPAVQQELILEFRERPDPACIIWFDLWKEGGIYLFEDEEGVVTPVLLKGEADDNGTKLAERVADAMPITGADGAPLRLDPALLEFAETDSRLRRAMKEVADLAALAHIDPAKRIRAIQDSAVGQNPEKLPALLLLEKTERNPAVLAALKESIAIIRLRSEDRAEQIAAAKSLGQLRSIAAGDTLRTIQREANESGDADLAAATREAVIEIDLHISRVNAFGTLFRGLSLGSVLLVVAIGLAITFGLMGVINMAHGELIAVGAYTTYVVQSVFDSGLRLSPFGFSLSIPGMDMGQRGTDLYFIIALPASFLVAALVGLLLERSVIQYLYRRPLESLLATWGISLVLQQLFRLVFGANNVQVSSPAWLSGNWTVSDVIFGWNRVFVISFAILIVLGTWLVINKTSLGLLMRAVMQNRGMAACMGVRTERVNMLTFSFGCGLAGLAGAFLSQIGNVGPSLGQSYIVDSFMTVVVGGVGNILGTVISAIGIGLVDQSLQQYLGNPVIGKIIVLGAIILFLQWRPAGLFATRSRTLD